MNQLYNFVENNVRIFLEYQAENSVVESGSMDSSLTKTVSDTVDTPD